MIILRKYGVLTEIVFPIIKRSAVDFAVSADYTPAAGDVKISKDAASPSNTTNLPRAITMGNGAMWGLTLTAAEMQAGQIAITIIDASTKAIEDQMLLIDTYGQASAKHQFDLNSATVTADVASLNGSTNWISNFRSMFDGTGYAGGTTRMKVDTNIKKNAAFSGFIFFMQDSNGAGVTGLTVTAQRSLDGAAFAACANSPSEIGAGFYKLDLAAADLNANIVALKFTGGSALTCAPTIITQP